MKNEELMRYGLLLLLFFSLKLNGQSTIESLVNQKLVDISYVSNPDTVLDTTTISKINSRLSYLESNTTVQVAIVAVNSIGDADQVDFAQKLFEKWGIGQKEKSNGLLILLVKDKRVIRFHTGYGLEGTLPDITCKCIEKDFMVPEFKNDDYNAGMLAGVFQVEKILTDPAYAEELKSDVAEPELQWDGFVFVALFFLYIPVVIAFIVKNANGHFANSKHPKQTPYPEMRLKRWQWVLEFVVIPGFILLYFDVTSENIGLCFFALYLYFMFTLFHRLVRVNKVIERFQKQQEYYETVEFIRKGQPYWLFMAFLFPFPFLLYFFYHLARKKLYRNHSRSCKKCQGNMQKLTELTEDQFLSKSEQMEETLKSADYDVWKCDSCENYQHWIYPNRHSIYKACPTCKALTYYLASDRTIRSASYSHSGEGEQIHTCKFCGSNVKGTYSIAQLTSSSSSYSSSSGGSSSSSSGGGSWGGGSSGGGGASSSW